MIDRPLLKLPNTIKENCVNDVLRYYDTNLSYKSTVQFAMTLKVGMVTDQIHVINDFLNEISDE